MLDLPERIRLESMSERLVSQATSPGTENALESASPANIECEPHTTVDVLQGKEKGMHKLAI